MKNKNLFFLMGVFLLFFVSFFIINFKNEIKKENIVVKKQIIIKKKNNDIEKKANLVKIEKKTREEVKKKKIEKIKKPVKIISKKEENYSDLEWKYIYGLAELRGYKKRVEISKNELEKIDGLYISREVIGDIKNIKNELLKYNVKLNLISGFRSVKDQRRIFKNKLNKNKIKSGGILNGKSDNLILKILEVSSAPGYSKHHTGRALDFSCGNYYYLNNSFKNTNCYRWLSANNFENSKKYNFYPSYPEGLEKQGPDPESWEFIWKITK